MDNTSDTSVSATIKIIVDFVQLIIVGCPIVIFKFGVYPFKRGFFCDDESIAHPYKSETINDGVLIGVSLSVTIIGIITGEIVLFKHSSTRRKYLQGCVYTVWKWRIHPVIVGIYKGVGLFLFAAAASQTATDIMKYSIGRLRPNFLAVCEPDWSKINCTDQYGRMRYVEDYVCLGDEKEVRESRLSHPSGHASFSLCCFLFLTFYLHAHLKWRGSKLLRPVLQVVLIYAALYTGLTRISDYRHHWSDVLGGFALGFIVCTAVVYSQAEFYKKRSMHDIAQRVIELNRYKKSSDEDMQPVVRNGDFVDGGTPGHFVKKETEEVKNHNIETGTSQNVENLKF